MVMELALEKQKGKENDLRRSLEAAWEEIANHESTSVDTVRRRSMHVSQLEKELNELRENQAEIQELKSSNAELKQQLETSQQEQQATQQLVDEQNLKLQEMMILMDKLRELDEQISRIETLESELLRVQSELESKEQKNLHLQETANALQMQLEERESQGTATRIRELEEEIENLRDSAAGSNTTYKPLQLLNATQGDCTTVSSEISRKLSETLQVLEESIMLPSTPNRGSVSSMDEPFFQMQDFIIIKQQLLALQESLLAQEQQQQLQQQKFEDHIKEDALHKQQYHSQIIAEIESQINSWKMAEALCADYIAYSDAPFTHTNTEHRIDWFNNCLLPTDAPGYHRSLHILILYITRFVLNHIIVTSTTFTGDISTNRPSPVKIFPTTFLVRGSYLCFIYFCGLLYFAVAENGEPFALALVAGDAKPVLAKFTVRVKISLSYICAHYFHTKPPTTYKDPIPLLGNGKKLTTGSTTVRKSHRKRGLIFGQQAPFMQGGKSSLKGFVEVKIFKLTPGKRKQTWRWYFTKPKSPVMFPGKNTSKLPKSTKVPIVFPSLESRDNYEQQYGN
ncbi:ribosome-binding protein 1-like [Penaeus monodon]|uniref:ribosome-binding protein 1-like n=1 Tax=Penaeus monodon TaxID=6687 RepID=UPI0018A7941D|nr:ribosome-binding protein 1-like [Penaeus monodon]